MAIQINESMHFKPLHDIRIMPECRIRASGLFASRGQDGSIRRSSSKNLALTTRTEHIMAYILQRMLVRSFLLAKEDGEDRCSARRAVPLVWQSSAEPTVYFWFLPALIANPGQHFIAPSPYINFDPGVHPSSPAPPENNSRDTLNVTVTQW